MEPIEMEVTEEGTGRRCPSHPRVEIIRTTFAGISGEYCPECAAEEDAALAENERESARKAALEAVSRDLGNRGLTPRFQTRTFDNFEATTPKRKEVLAATRRMADAIVRGDRSFTGGLFVGSPGTGKNHLAAAIANDIRPHGKTFLVTTMAKLARDIKRSWGRDADVSERETIARFTTPDLLVVDEIGIQFGSETELNFLTEIVGDRYDNYRPTIFISNLSPAQVVALVGERVRDRITEGGGSIDFGNDSFRQELRWRR